MPFRRRSDVPAATIGAAYERLFFTREESTQVRRLVSQLKLTSYALFRTAMTIALHYHTSKQRVAIWANFANRRHPEFVPTLGWYANTHIVSVGLEPDMSCASLWLHVAAVVAEAQMYEALPLSALWQRLGCSLDTHDTRVNFDVLPRGPQRTSPPAVEVTVLPVAPRNMDFDIRVWENGGLFRLVAMFSVGRYQSAAVQAFLDSMRRIVTTLAETPDLRVSDCRRLVALDGDPAVISECASTCADPPDDLAKSIAAEPSFLG
ncbi:MAG: condensation domain-containing protein [Vicinamibacterales bacterium]